MQQLHDKHTGREQVLSFFATHAIPYRLYEHPEFRTVADAQRHAEVHGHLFHTAGVVGAKNLFLKDYVNRPKGDEVHRYYLYVLPDTKRADLKAFAAHVGEKKVTFGTPEELLQLLGVTPGSVSLCGLLNDPHGRVHTYVDNGLLRAELIHVHPNDNTASIELSREAFGRFLSALPHEVHSVEC